VSHQHFHPQAKSIENSFGGNQAVRCKLYLCHPCGLGQFIRITSANKQRCGSHGAEMPSHTSQEKITGHHLQFSNVEMA